VSNSAVPGKFSGATNRLISVLPSTTPCAVDKVAHDPHVLLAGVAVDDPAGRLLEDDEMHQGAVPLGRDEDLESVTNERCPKEVGFHHGCWAEPAQSADTVGDGCLSGPASPMPSRTHRAGAT